MPRMDEGRKRVIGIMAAILASLHMQRADDPFGGGGMDVVPKPDPALRLQLFAD